MKALITGITGQDGSYLAEFLLSKGYEVHGIIRRSSSFNTRRIDHIFDKLYLHYGDITDASNITNIIYDIKPDEIYHLAAMSHVKVSFEEPIYTTNVGILGTLRLFEAIRKSGINCKIYNASSSEMFGNSSPPQNELTSLNPKSPYGVAKAASYCNSINYRDGYKMFISNGILFNHTSPRRGDTFVTKKIINGIVTLLKGSKEIIMLGNLDSFRDFGFSPEYVELMWKILQLPKPDDFCIGTGISISIRDFLNKAFSYVGLPLRWEKTPSNFEGYIYGKKLAVIVNKLYYRPTEVNFLQADNIKALKILDWKPKILVDDIIKIMIDYELTKEGLGPIGEGMSVIKKYDFSWSRII